MSTTEWILYHLEEALGHLRIASRASQFAPSPRRSSRNSKKLIARIEEIQVEVDRIKEKLEKE